MAMLDRYKKTGGFNQLLTLLETCGAQKQAKFLDIIRQEDPRWADALLAKMIDLKRFLSWSDSAIAEVTGAMLELNVALVVSSLPEDQQVRILGTLPHIKRRKVEDLLESQKPTAGEVATSLNKLFETIRRLTQEGVLRLDKIDPNLFVDADIEDRLKQGKTIIGVPSATESLAKAAAATPGFLAEEAETPHLRVVTSMDPAQAVPGDGKDPRAAEQEIILLKKRVQILVQENAALKQELATANAKLDQIRKLS